MQVSEASRKAGWFSKEYALSVVVTIDNEHPIEQEIRHVNEAMIDWFKRHGKSCKDLLLTFVSDPALHDGITKNCEMLVNQDFEFTPLIQSLAVSIVLMNQNGQIVKELNMGGQ